MPFFAGSLVWAKVGDFPWWPARVVDAKEYQLDIPEGFDTAVVFLQTNDVSFLLSTDPQQLCMFNETDADKMDANGDSDLQAAIAIAKDERRRGADVEEEDEPEPIEEGEADDDGKKRGRDDSSDGDAEDNTKDNAEERERKRLRKEEKRRKKEEKKRRKQEEKERRAKEEKDRRKQEKEKEKEKEKDKEKADKKLNPEMLVRQSVLEEYKPKPKAIPRKRRVSDKELLTWATSLSKAIENEDYVTIQQTLSSLASIEVTLEQLASTKVGVYVGSIVASRQVSMQRFKHLAESIARFWWQKLPQNTKQVLKEQEEIDRASNDAVDGDMSGSEDHGEQLDELGSKLEQCFTPQDLEATTGGVDASHVANEIEKALQGKSHLEKLDVLEALQKPDNEELRRKLLRGDVTPVELIDMGDQGRMTPFEQEENEREIQRVHNEFASIHSRDTELDNVSTLYTCLQCGANNASVSELWHDKLGDEVLTIVARCLICGATWQVADT